MKSRAILLMIAASAVTANFAEASNATTPVVQVRRELPGDDVVRAIESKLRAQEFFLSDEPLNVDRAAAVRVTSADGESALAIPVIGSVRVAPHDRVTRCLVAVLRGESETTILRRENTGFADDYEPCTGVKSLSVLDLNSDGMPDLVYRYRVTDARGRRYMLLDAYLVTKDLGVCFSPEASTRLTVRYMRQWRASPTAALLQRVRKDVNLKALACVRVEVRR